MKYFVISPPFGQRQNFYISNLLPEIFRRTLFKKKNITDFLFELKPKDYLDFLRVTMNELFNDKYL